MLETLLKHSKVRQLAYKLCCQLTGIYNSKISKSKATRRINKWINTVEQYELNCFNIFVTTLKKYKTEIINYCKGRHTSGFVEGINNKVKTLKRRCYGITCEKSLFRRLFLDLVGYAEYGLNKGSVAICENHINS